jgi:hypothetical protein
VSRYGSESLIGFGEGIDSSTEVYGDESEPGEHADASVFDFGFAEEVHGCKVGETEWIESSITYVSREVLGIREEGKSL